jgi:DNA-directed RNA polymerase subunit RPC12/RpoP
MLIEVYGCQECGQPFNVKRSQAEPATDPVCPECGSMEVKGPLVPTCGMECASGGGCGCVVPGFA